MYQGYTYIFQRGGGVMIFDDFGKKLKNWTSNGNFFILFDTFNQKFFDFPQFREQTSKKYITSGEKMILLRGVSIKYTFLKCIESTLTCLVLFLYEEYNLFQMMHCPLCNTYILLSQTISTK